MIEFQTALTILEKPSATARELEQAVVALAAELRDHVVVGPDGVVEDWSVDAAEIEGALCKTVERLVAAEQRDTGFAEAA